MRIRLLLTSGAILAALSVILGAFGAHALSAHLGAKLSVWQTGIQYQMMHSLALIVAGLLMPFVTYKRLLLSAGICFIMGIICFSGSLYVIGLISVKNLGLVTPVGGLFFIAGWVFFLVAAFSVRSDIRGYS